MGSIGTHERRSFNQLQFTASPSHRPLLLPLNFGRSLALPKGRSGDHMANTGKEDKSQLNAAQRRKILKKLGRFAVVSAPTVTLLLAAKAKPGYAKISCAPSSRAFKTRIKPVNGAAVLEAVATLPVRVRR